MSKLDWDKTLERIYEEVPEADKVDFEGLFRDDPKILGNLINDMIKVSVSQKGRPGKRSASSEEDVAGDLRKLMNVDHSTEVFPTALRHAMGTKSLRQTASLSGLDKMTLHRLLQGRGQPATPEQMEALAVALKKDPSYFVEYRAAYICNALYRMLIESPESAVVFYTKLKNRGRRGGRT